MTKLSEKKKDIAARMKRSSTKPATAADYKLSIKHLKDSMKFHKDHAKEHEAQIKEDKKLIEQRKKASGSIYSNG